VVALLLLLWVCAAGTLLARKLDPLSTRPAEALALGAAVGLALFAGFGFVLGSAFGLSPLTVVGAALATAAVGFVLGEAPGAVWRSRAGGSRPTKGVIVLCLLTSLVVARLADRTLFENESGIATGDRHNFGDLPFHMAIAAGFAYADNFPPDHPELGGVPLTYPFFCDLISGMMVAVGGTWRDAFLWPTLILGLSVPVALVRFGEAVTGSRALGRTAAALTFFSGGLGFLALTDAQALNSWWTTGPDLTIHDRGVRYANFITTLFVPQRSILFGWPLLFFALAFLVESRKAEPGMVGKLWLRAGILGSLLPLVHSHSFVVLGLCATFLATRVSLRAAVPAFARGVIPLAAPAILFMFTHNSLSSGQFFAWQPGFDGGATLPLRYWLTNAGLFLPLVIFGIARAAPSLRFLALPFATLFIAANLFRLAPWIWDNMKFLAPAHAGLAPFAALALGFLWGRGRAGRAAAIASLIGATLSGALDVSKVALSGGEYQIFSHADVAFGARVRETTAPTDTILTAPTHNHGALLSGRRVFMGYEGHLWSHGLDYLARKPVAEAVFRGEPQPRDGPAGRFPKINAIAVTPAEWALISRPEAMAGLPSLVESPYRLLRVR